ncbi:MAG: LysE family translocator [Spirochaetales bacterium]|nr:LysE family translocator [Spirochaetales bacterium]
MDTKIISLLIFTIVMTVTPGPNNMLLTISGTKYGYIKSTPFIIGIALGLISQIILFSLGLNAVFEIFPLFNTIIKIIGFSYLIYISIKIFTTDSKVKVDSKIDKPLSIFKGIAFQYLNPKAYLMTLTASTLYPKLIVIIIFYLIIPPLSTSLWALFGSFIGKFINGDRGYVNKILGILTAFSAVLMIK